MISKETRALQLTNIRQIMHCSYIACRQYLQTSCRLSERNIAQTCGETITGCLLVQVLHWFQYHPQTTAAFACMLCLHWYTESETQTKISTVAEIIVIWRVINSERGSENFAFSRRQMSRFLVKTTNSCPMHLRSHHFDGCFLVRRYSS